MTTHIIFPEYRDELEFTRYPFADATSLKSSEESQVIEGDVFLDASLYPIGGHEHLYITSILIEARAVTITVGDYLNAKLASTTFDPLDAPEVLDFADAYGRPAGVLVSDATRLSRFGAWPLGTHTFAKGTTEFAASCVVPTPEIGVRGLLTTAGDLFTGDIWIVGDDGVVCRDDGDGNIRVDIVGDPLYVRKLCAPIELFTAQSFLRTINGQSPDVNGNYNLVVGSNLNAHTIMRIYGTEAGLVIEAIGSSVQQVV